MKKSRRLIALAEKYSANNYHPLDVMLTRGQGCWVWDVDGRRYLDMLSAYSALNQGHRHPKIVAAARRQLDRLTLTSRAFHNDRMGEFLKFLCRLAGKSRALPMNSGAEAVETAIKACRKWGYLKKKVPPGQAEIVVCRNNFHGRTTTIVGFSTEAQYREGFGPYAPGFTTIAYDDLQSLQQAITPNTVGFLVEPIQGEGGVIVPRPGFLKKGVEICRQNNILYLADEIQTGLGRTGALFCCDHERAQPDILIVGKALGGGIYPVSAILADDNIMEVFTPGDHGSTFGGNPLAAAVGIAALNVIVNEKLPERALKLGDYFMEQLRRIKSRHVLDVRGRGLLIGVELKRSSGPARPYCERLRDRGILAKETHEQVVRFAPPLVITKREIDWALARIAPVLSGER